MVETIVTIDTDKVETECVGESEDGTRHKRYGDKIQNPSSVMNTHFSLPKISISLRQCYKTIIDSKVPYYSCILTYIFICLLGNIVTAVVLIKHRQIFAGEQSINNTSTLPFQINQSQNFEDNVDLDDLVNEDLLLGLLDLVYNESEHEVSNN